MKTPFAVEAKGAWIHLIVNFQVSIVNYFLLTASNLHEVMHAPHLMHLDWSMT